MEFEKDVLEGIRILEDIRDTLYKMQDLFETIAESKFGIVIKDNRIRKEW